MLKIGLIGGQLGEKVSETPYRKWMENVSPGYYDKEEGAYLFEPSLAAAIKDKYKGTEVKYTTTLNETQLQKNDVNFLVGKNLLNYWEKSPEEYKKAYNIMKNKKNNIYPPLKEQFFLYNKGDYLKYYEKKGIPIAPTFLIKKSRHVKTIINTVKKHNWEAFVMKPYYAYANASIKRFDMNDPKLFTNVSNYLDKNKKYPAFICQEVMIGFMTKWEVKSFWINGKYAYHISTKACDQVFDEDDIYGECPDDIGEVNDKIVRQVKRYGKKVIQYYPSDKPSPPLYLRIDFGCCGGNTLNTSKYFLNEIEYAGCGIYLEIKNTLSLWVKGYYEKAKELTKYIKRSPLHMRQVSRKNTSRRRTSRRRATRRKSIRSRKRTPRR